MQAIDACKGAQTAAFLDGGTIVSHLEGWRKPKVLNFHIYREGICLADEAESPPAASSSGRNGRR